MVRPQHSFPVTITICFSLIVIWVAMVINGVSLLEPQPDELINWGSLLDVFVEKGEWWRLITSGFVHYGIIHLGVNVVALLILGSDFEKRYGSLLLLLVLFSGLLISAAGSIYWNLFQISTGASGGIMAIAGCLLMGIVFLPQSDSHRRIIAFAQLVFIILINIGLGLYLEVIDNAAHISGLIWGIVVGLLVFPWQNQSSIIVFARFMSVLLLAVSVLFLVVIKPEPYRYWYYTMFNSFIKNDAQTVELLNSNAGPENPLISLAGVNEASDVWNKNMEMLNLFNNAPKQLEPDLMILRKIFHLRNNSLIYMKNYVSTGDLIYVDSIQQSNEKIKNLPPLKYWLIFDADKSDTTISQDNVKLYPATIWYDSTWKETSKAHAVYFRSGSKDDYGNFHGEVKDYFLKGDLQMNGNYEHGIENGIFFYYNQNGTYSTYGKYKNGAKTGDWIYFNDQGKKLYELTFTDLEVLIKNSWNVNGNREVTGGEGTMNFYFPDGSVSETGKVVHGKKTGQWLGFFEDGKPYYNEWYKEGLLVSGKSLNKSGDQFNYTLSEESPSVFGGRDTWFHYLDAELKYPEKAKNAEYKGTAVIRVTIDDTGKVIFAEPYRRIGFGCDEEALRVINNWKNFVPGKTRGQFTTKDLYISIDFPP